MILFNQLLINYICASGIRLGEPQLTKEATRVASGFVAVILAQAVAEYVRIVHEEDYSDSGYNEVSKSQVCSRGKFLFFLNF